MSAAPRPARPGAARSALSAAISALRLDPGFDAAPASRDLATRAAVALAVSLGLQLTVLAILTVGPLAEPFAAADLTSMGRKNMRPEHDMPAFYVGCFATVALAWVVVRAFGARLRGLAGPAAERAARRGAGVHAVLAAASLAAFAALATRAASSIGTDPRLAPATLAGLALPGAAALVALTVDHALARRRARRPAA
jgi:hypothetical protein